MLHRFVSIAVFLLAAMLLPAHARETPAPAAPALAEAMKYFNVVLLADPQTGNPVVETRRDADGTNPREMIVAFIDAEDARNQVAANGAGSALEGRLINAGVLLAKTGGQVIWRAAPANSEFTASGGATAIGYYIHNEQDQPLTQPVDGRIKTVIYMDKESAQKAQSAHEATFAANGTPLKLQVAAVDALELIEKVRTGERNDLVFASAKSTDRWLAQWDKGARLISDYKDESQEAIEALADALFQ